MANVGLLQDVLVRRDIPESHQLHGGIPSHQICGLCQNIPWDRLPSEEEPALSHSPSLDALNLSAQSCALCSMLSRALVDLDTPHAPEEGPRWTITDSYPLRSGGNRIEVVEYGESPSVDERNNNRATFDDLPQVRQLGRLRPFLFGSWWKFKDSNTPNQLIGLGVRLGRTPLIEDAQGNERNSVGEDGIVNQRISFRGTHIRLRIGEDSPLATTIPGRMRHFVPGGYLALDRICRMVRQCDSDHQCVEATTSLPTRVLDVGTENQTPIIRLIETLGKTGSYIALSHCWGGGVPVLTNRANYNARQNGIPMTTLPPKFQDAVKLTRLLRKRYLWIDSLCIVQDDKNDWETEASRMADVYSNAWLTIAAAGSKNTSEGIFDLSDINEREFNRPADQASTGIGHPTALFAHRNSDSDMVSAIGREFTHALFSNAQYGMIGLTYEWMPSSQRSRPNTYCIPYFGSLVNVLKGQPLSARAWALQERALSPRILHVCTDQIYWECRLGTTAEDGSRLDRSPIPLPTIIQRQLLPEFQLGLGGDRTTTIVMHVTQDRQYLPIEGHPPPAQVPYGRWDGGWIALVQEFSRRNMTKPKDKLPALSGIARALHNVTGDQYLAGLWKKTILEDLYWRVYPREEITVQRPGGFTFLHGETLPIPTRPDAYRAPSWTWASVDAVIIYKPLDYSRKVCRYVASDINELQIDKFGQVREGGWIRLEAPLIPVSAAPNGFAPSPYEPLGFGEIVQIVVHDDISYGEAFFDMAGEEHYPCFALFLDSSNAILVRESDLGGAPYTRVGIAKFLRTKSQRIALPMNMDNIKAKRIPYGPIGPEFQKTVVTIH